MSAPAAVVRHYFELVADLRSSPDALADVLDPAVRITEHPNAINPGGTVRDRDAAITALIAGKGLLATQAIDLHELVVSGDRAAVRATWRGTIAERTNALAAGTELVAHIAAWLTVVDGRIREHETFDCYEPLPSGA
jgi:ketosteroid isomerase-like protein